MPRELCISCREEKKNVCPILVELTELQKRVPGKVRTEEDLEFIGELIAREQKLHELARERCCYYHNEKTLKLPKYKKIN